MKPLFKVGDEVRYEHINVDGSKVTRYGTVYAYHPESGNIDVITGRGAVSRMKAKDCIKDDRA